MGRTKPFSITQWIKRPLDLKDLRKDKWHDVVLTYDGSGDPSKTDWYINGIKLTKWRKFLMRIGSRIGIDFSPKPKKGTKW